MFINIVLSVKHHWNQHICVSVRTLCLIFAIIISVVNIHVEISKAHSQKEYARCQREQTVSTYSNSTSGCSSSTQHGCRICINSKTVKHSKRLEKIPKTISMFPRGTPGFWKRKSRMNGNIITDYVLTPTRICQDKCPYLLAVQLSRAPHALQRDVIRSTWGSVTQTGLWPQQNVNADVQLLFILAHPQSMNFNKNIMYPYAVNKSFESIIKEEHNKHGDMLYINMLDSYTNLTLKLLSGFQWVVNNCPHIKFLLKVDWDTFVNVPLMLDLLIDNEARLEYSILGHVYKEERRVHRDGIWGVRQDAYPMPTFPVYASGCAYVLSRRALTSITDMAMYTNQIPVEDAFITGVLAKKVGVQLYTYYGFFTHMKDLSWHWCALTSDNKVVGTGLNRASLHYKLWSMLIWDQWECARHRDTRYAYSDCRLSRLRNKHGIL